MKHKSGIGLAHGELGEDGSNDISHEFTGVHGMGPKLLSMHNEALHKASPARADLHQNRVFNTLAREGHKTGYNQHNQHSGGVKPGTKPKFQKNHEKVLSAVMDRHLTPNSKKSTKAGKSNWAAWNAAHKGSK